MREEMPRIPALRAFILATRLHVWILYEAERRQVLVDNPPRLYGFAPTQSRD